jgi:hypothetical protein
VRCSFAPEPDLWLRITGEPSIVARVRPSIEPFLPVAVLAAGMRHADLVIRHPVDAVRLANLRANLVPLLTFALGLGDTRINVEADDSPPAPPQRGVGTAVRAGVRRLLGDEPAAGPPEGSLALAYSCGLDSTWAYRRLQAQGDEPTCLVNIDAGAHGPRPDLVVIRRERVRRAAGELGLPLLLIDTDFHEVAPMEHVKVHPFRNGAAAQALHGAVAAVAFATTYPLGVQVFAHAPEDPDLLGPVAHASMAWSGMPILEVGHDTPRPERMAELAADPFLQAHLDLCIDPDHQRSVASGGPVNCGRCFKCMRELVVIDHLGVLDAFAPRFDLTLYREAGAGFIARLQAAGGTNDRAVLRFIGAPETPA